MVSTHPELNAVLGSMRRFRRANTMLKKVETLRERLTPDNILPLDLLYCGAPHTRRWSSKGFNVQNLDKEPLIVNPLTGESVWTRNWLIPRLGHIFLIYDFSQIEPRCLNWLVENEEMMAAMRNGFSYYEAYVIAARQQKRVGWSGTPGTLKKEVGVARYTKIKNESLGCGYGMGWKKYMTYANVEEEEAKQVITGFRANNPKITAFWCKLQDLIVRCVLKKEKGLALQLPTGEHLKYFGIRPYVREAKAGYEGYVIRGDLTHNSHQPRLWGGVLTENVTQRMARDVLANAIINPEDAGLRVAWHCHDEVILEVPLDSKDEAKAEAYRILTTPPAWAPDLPLGVEGEFAECYVK